MREPEIHSHITDELPNNHKWAQEQLYCKICIVTIHAGNNECMQTWVETGNGNYCLKCWVKELQMEEQWEYNVLSGKWGLE